MAGLLINGKALAELTEDEMREWCEALREKREALRNDAIKKKKEADDKGKAEPAAPRTPRAPRKNEAKDLQANILAMLGDDNED